MGFKLGAGFGGGGCSAFAADGDGLGAGDSRRFAFLLADPELLSLLPKSPLDVPGTTV